MWHTDPLLGHDRLKDKFISVVMQVFIFSYSTELPAGQNIELESSDDSEHCIRKMSKEAAVAHLKLLSWYLHGLRKRTKSCSIWSVPMYSSLAAGAVLLYV